MDSSGASAIHYDMSTLAGVGIGSGFAPSALVDRQSEQLFVLSQRLNDSNTMGLFAWYEIECLRTRVVFDAFAQ